MNLDRVSLMKNNRKIEDFFLNDLEEKGALYAFTKKVKDDDNLELCFRGNDNAINIYYNNLSVWKIYSRSKGYKVEVSLHKSVSPATRENIANKLEKKEDFVSFSGKREIMRYPWIKKPSFDDGFVDRTYKDLKPMIEEYFENEKHIEKKRQQELFRYLSDYKKEELYAYDLELQDKGESKKGQNLSDMIAVRYEGNEAKALVLIEVKSTKQACKDKNSDISSHIAGMWDYINNPLKMEAKKEEAFDIISQYKELGIRATPDNIESIKSIEKYEMEMILTDDAIKYYKDNRGIIKEEIEKKTKGKNPINCKFYAWKEKELEEIE